MRVVNGREIPDVVGEFTNQYAVNMLVDLLTECANLFGSTPGGDTFLATSGVISDTLTVTGAIYANGGVDRSTAAALSIGATNASALTVSKSGVTTTIKGILSIDENVIVKKSATIVLGANSSVSGSGFPLTASATAALKIYADDVSTLYGAAAVRSAVFRNLVTIAHSNETSIFGSQSQFKIAPAAGIDVTLTTGNRAGSWNYCELAGLTAKTITLSGTSKATAGAFCMVDWDGVGALTLSANHVLAGCAVLTNVTKTGGTFTQTGTFAGFATLNNSSSSYAAFAAGLFFGPNSVTTPFVFTDESGVASVDNGTILADISATANAGYIRVVIGTTVRYIPVYAAKAS